MHFLFPLVFLSLCSQCVVADVLTYSLGNLSQYKGFAVRDFTSIPEHSVEANHQAYCCSKALQP